MVVGEIRERQDNQADGGRSTSKFSGARRVGETLRGQGLATPLILGGWLAVVFILFAEHGRGQEHLPELLEIDGIELDRNAAAKLTGSSGSVGGRRRDASPYPDDATDKMLKQHEAGDLYGVALDKNAAAVLHRARVKSVSSRGREGSSGGTGKVKGGKAQALLERGESELDSERYRSALRDLAKARDDWKGQGRQDWHWAETLVQDVLRSHPELRHHEQEKENAGTARATKAGGKVVSKKWGSDAGSQHGLIKTAAKELASGKQFRSLYGLARDEAARRAGAPEWSPPAESAQGPAALQPSVPGRMSTLSQVPVAARQPSGGEGGDVLQLAVDSAVKAAEKKLQLENHLALLHEEASIRRNAQEILRGQAGPRARVAAKGARIRQQQLRAFLAPRVAFSQKVSPSAATAYGRRVAQAAQQRLGQQTGSSYEQTQMKQVYQQPTEHALAQPAFQMQQPQGYAQAQTQSEYQMQQPEAYQPTSSQLQQQPMLYSPQQMQTPATTASVAPQEELQQPLGSGDVPVVNINLPAGQRLAPGQYAMDGDLVPDQGQAGAYDFVGNLVPQQQPGNADPAYARHAL